MHPSEWVVTISMFKGPAAAQAGCKAGGAAAKFVPMAMRQFVPAAQDVSVSGTGVSDAAQTPVRSVKELKSAQAGTVEHMSLPVQALHLSRPGQIHGHVPFDDSGSPPESTAWNLARLCPLKTSVPPNR
jgi:hypothetical protein